MIARYWRGWTRAEDIDRYVDYVNETGVEGLAGTPGNRGVQVLTRVEGERAEIVVLSLWDSLDSVRAFAGEDAERAVFYPEDEAFLVERDFSVTHYQVPVVR
jgi:heme-degrading monooxygenase HmoA